MKFQKLALPSLLFILASLVGCNSIPPSYEGRFSGVISGQRIDLKIGSKSISVGINGKVEKISRFVNGFDKVVDSVMRAEGGVYILPSAESMFGIPMDGPWVPRFDLRSIGYHNGVKASDRYDDIYVVIPFPAETGQPPFDFGGMFPPIQGGMNDFHGFVLYAQIDKQEQGKVNVVNVEIAPQTGLVAADMGVGPVKMKMLNIGPEASAGVSTFEGALTRQ